MIETIFAVISTISSILGLYFWWFIWSYWENKAPNMTSGLVVVIKDTVITLMVAISVLYFCFMTSFCENAPKNISSDFLYLAITSGKTEHLPAVSRFPEIQKVTIKHI